MVDGGLPTHAGISCFVFTFFSCHMEIASVATRKKFLLYIRMFLIKKVISLYLIRLPFFKAILFSHHLMFFSLSMYNSFIGTFSVHQVYHTNHDKYKKKRRGKSTTLISL